MPKAVIVDALRTPLGKYGGSLRSVRPDDLMALLLKTMTTRHDLPSVEDVIIGCANQAGEDSRNVARMASLTAGLPWDVPGQTVNRLCGSSMQAVINAALAIETGNGDVFLAGGVESMSRGPYVFAKSSTPYAFGNMTVYDSTIGWRFNNPVLMERIRPYSMGETAEVLYESHRIPREAQDRFSAASHAKAVQAHQTGRFRDEIVPVTVPQKKAEPLIVDRDEGPREDTTVEKLAALPPAFKKDGVVTAGNSCPMSDGAALVLVMSEEAARDHGFDIAYRLASHAVTGLHPDLMGMGPVEASAKALRRAGLGLDDMDVVEINEAFAVQILACLKGMNLSETVVNPNGGAIALGHPLGCSGARIITTLVHEMRRRDARFGLAAMCVGLGQGIATIWEKVQPKA